MMATVGFYSAEMELIDTSAIMSNYADYHRDTLEAEAQGLADECQIAIRAWAARNDEGEPDHALGIDVQPHSKV